MLKQARYGVHAAIIEIAKRIGWAEIERLSGRRSRAVRYWGEPNSNRRPSIDIAILLDTAFLRAGGDRAPIMEAYQAEVERLLAAPAADHAALGADLAAAAQECGEALSAGFVAVATNATPRQLRTALVEAEQASLALDGVSRRLTGLLHAREAA